MPVQPSDDSQCRLLVLLGRKELPNGVTDELRLLLEEEEDWEWVINLAGYHGIQPLLYYHLRHVGPGVVPDEALARLRAVVGLRSARSIALEYELGQLAELFGREGLPLLAVKGPVLAHSVYGSIALRPFVDLDLIVRRGDFPRVEALLEREGYKSVPLGQFQKASYLFIHGQYTFWRRISRTGASTVLDVHTAVMPPGYAYAEDFGDLFERSITLPIAGHEVHALAREDLLVVLCFHGFKNRWDRLKYFCDVAELLRTCPDLDWEVTYERARAMRSVRVLRLGLALTHRLLDAPLPDAVAQDVQRDRRVQALSDEVLQRLPRQARMRVEPYWDRVRLNVLAQDGVVGGLRYGAYAAARRVSELYLPGSD